MSLTPTLATPSDVLCKLHREQYRTFHSKHLTHKADHLYNFCITALAVKDFIFEYFHIVDDKEKQSYYDEWNKSPELIAATEIANTSKHCVLRDKNKKIRGAKTRAINKSTSEVINVYENREGKIFTEKKDKLDYEIQLENGNTLKAWEFTMSVVDYWQKYFQKHSIPSQKQTDAELYGRE